MNSIFFLDYVLVNPHTGEEELWNLHVHYIYHPPDALDPEDFPHGELLRIEDAHSNLPIERAIPYWTEHDEAIVNQRLQLALADPLIYRGIPYGKTR